MSEEGRRQSRRQGSRQGGRQVGREAGRQGGSESEDERNRGLRDMLKEETGWETFTYRCHAAILQKL